jgi:hypothetical protein
MEQVMSGATIDNAVRDFLHNLFRLIRYDEPGFMVQSGLDPTFFMCGEEHPAQTNV